MVNDFTKVTHADGKISWAILPEVCKSCGICVEKCPVKCLSYSDTEIEYLGNPLVTCEISKCITCRTCENNCPEGAIEVEGKR